MATIWMIRSRVNFLSICKVCYFYFMSTLLLGLSLLVGTLGTSMNSKDLTGEAESGLERLHQCAEKDLQKFLPSVKSDSTETTASTPAEFGDFRVKLAGLTR